MRRTATTLLLLITTIWASAQIKQTYLPDFKKGQTAIYEYILSLGLGDVYKRQVYMHKNTQAKL